MNKYERIVSKLNKNRKQQLWCLVAVGQVPDDLLKYGQIRKAVKTDLTEDLTLYLYSALRPHFDAEYEQDFTKEHVGGSIFCDDVEVEAFDEDNVDSLVLFDLLKTALDSALDVSGKIDEYLND